MGFFFNANWVFDVAQFCEFCLFILFLIFELIGTLFHVLRSMRLGF